MTQTVLRQACVSALLAAAACGWSNAEGATARHPVRHASRHVVVRVARQTSPIPTVRRFLTSFSQRQPAETLVDVSLVSEVPPRQWSGPGAFQAWTASLQQVVGPTEAPLTLRGSTRADRGMAYVIAPVLFSYQTRGAVVVEPATLAISLRRERAGWKIVGWAWAGPNPQTSEQAAVATRYLPAG